MFHARRHKSREARREDIARERFQRAAAHRLLYYKPVTMRQEFAYWLAWRFTAAAYFAAWGLPDYHPNGEPVIMSDAQWRWYLPRFIQGLKYGPRGVRRARRELERIHKM